MDNQTGGKIVWTTEVSLTGLRTGLAAAVTQVSAAGGQIRRVSDNIQNSLGGAGRGFQDLAKKLNQADFEQAGNRLNSIADAIQRTAVVGGVAGGLLGGLFVKSAADLEKTSTAFQVLIGDVETANRLFGQLAVFAQQTPFEFPQIARGAQTLLGFGVQAENVRDLIAQIGDVAGATGGDFNALALVTGQVFAQGRIQAQDFYQIINSGAGALGPLIAKNLGVNGVGALRKQFEEGTVNAQAFFDALRQATAEGGFAFGGTEKLAQTFSGRLSTLKDQLLEVGRNLLGVKVDPQLGLVVQPGGLFDRLGQLLTVISDASAVLGPKLAAGFQFLVDNGPTILSIIASIAAGFLAFRVLGTLIPLIGTFFGAIAGGATTLGALVAVAGGPVTLVMAGLAVLFGVIVYNAVQKLQGGLSGLVSSFSTGMKQLGDAGNKALPAATAQTKGLTSQTDALGRSARNAARDYRQALADIVRAHQSTSKELTASLEEEKRIFAETQDERKASFEEGQAELDQTHQDRASVIQRELDVQLAKGRAADAARVTDLQDALDRENAEYSKSTAKKLAQYQKDTANAEKQHEAKVSDLQLKLDEETAFQRKHAETLKGIRAEDALDEVERLKQSRADQIESFNLQRAQIEASSQAQAVNLASNFSKIPDLVDKGKFEQLGKNLGSAIGNALKDAVIEAFKALPGQIVNINVAVLNEINKFTKGLTNFIGPTAPLFAGFKVLSELGKGLKIPGFASGVQNFGGGLAVVGERGPEIVNLPGGSDVFSNEESRGMVGGTTYNINVDVAGIAARSRSDLRAIGVDIVESINENLRARRLPEIGGGNLRGVTG